MTTEDGSGAPKRRLTPARKAEAQRLVETTELSQAEIARRIGILEPSLSRMVSREGWLRPPTTARRKALLQTVRARVDAEMAETDRIFADAGVGGAGSDAAGKAARNLATMIRSLRELARFDEEQGRVARGEADDGEIDVDEFRRLLAERIDRLRGDAGG